LSSIAKGARGYGQQSHDRYALQYSPRLNDELPTAWRVFIAELHAPTYRDPDGYPP
jgi:hypothetical protein